MTVYLELADYLLIAEHVLGLPAEVIANFNRIGLAASALAAPQAGFGGVEAYPDFATKAAVLCWHLVKNHPLPDGNKRAAFLSGWLFMELNGRPFDGEGPEIDVPMMEHIAAGEATQDEIIAWLEKRTASPR